MNKLVIMTGASGAGKTSITQAFAEAYSTIGCVYFDSAGVPSSEATGNVR